MACLLSANISIKTLRLAKNSRWTAQGKQVRPLEQDHKGFLPFFPVQGPCIVPWNMVYWRKLNNALVLPAPSDPNSHATTITVHLHSFKAYYTGSNVQLQEVFSKVSRLDCGAFFGGLNARPMQKKSVSLVTGEVKQASGGSQMWDLLIRCGLRCT